MHHPHPEPDLRAWARRRIAEALSVGDALSVAEIPRAWPVTRTLLRAIAREMLDEGILVRVPPPHGGGRDRFALAPKPGATPRRSARSHTSPLRLGPWIPAARS